MKLRNKKTGEIVETDYMFGVNVPTAETFGCKSYDQIAAYSSLAELNEEWEDYEEPEMFYWIDYDGKICKAEIGTMDRTKIKQIGNYFETKEEAEKAAKKLKALKRLRDKGFRFERWFGRWLVGGEYNDETRADLDLLFSGEDE